jgi:hypothetical protein
VVEALRPIGPICLVGGPPDLGDRHALAGATFLESIERGLGLVSSERFLLATADLPYLTTEAARDLVERSRPDVMLSYPIVPSAEAERRFPGMRRTTLSLKEGRFTGGNLAVVHRELMNRSLPILKAAYAARKSPIRLAAMVGLGVLARVAFARIFPATLGIAALESAVGRFLGAPVQAIVTAFPELGGDIDCAEQYLSLLALQKSAPPAVN